MFRHIDVDMTTLGSQMELSLLTLYCQKIT